MTILSTNGFAESFSAVQLSAARPTFELQFNMLQNSLLNQLDVKIEKLQANSVNKVDEFVALQQKKLSRSISAVGIYGEGTQHNKDIVGEISASFEKLQAASTNLDEAAFNKYKTEIDDLTLQLKKVDGYAAGFTVKDGLDNFRENKSGILNFSDYADAATRDSALIDFQSSVNNSLSVLEINLDAAYTVHSKVSAKLSSINIGLNADALASQSELMNDIEKMRNDHSNFLKYLSIAFEVAQNNAQQLADSFNGNAGQKGTVVDMIS
jgi:hypothetical protein